MTSIRSSGLPHLAGLSGLTNFRLNRMDLPCSRCSLWLHAGGTNPGSTAGHSLCCAACDSAFPFERQGRLLRSRSISGLFSRSLYSGLQPPYLRFAVAVTGHHARLVRGCSLGFTAAAISGDGDQRTCKAQLPHHRAYGPYHGGSRVWLTRTEQGQEAERSEVRIGEPSKLDFGQFG